MLRDLALHLTRVKALPPLKDAIVDDVQQRVDVDQLPTEDCGRTFMPRRTAITLPV